MTQHSSIHHHHHTFFSINHRRRTTSSSFSFSLLFSILFFISSLSLTQASPNLNLNSTIKSTFDESLTLKPLPDGKLLASFSFKLNSISTSSSESLSLSQEQDPLTTQNFNLLPRQLIQIARSRNVKDLHLSLNTGRWDYQRWGFPIFNVRQQVGHGRIKEIEVGEENIASGAQMWANLIDGDGDGDQNDKNRSNPSSIPSNLLTRWRSLASSLAGLFCASLDALDSKVTSIPRFPEIFTTSSTSTSTSTSSSSSSLVNPQDLDSSTTLLHGFLPTENICTENLTPFLKSLPCKNKAGLASLLTPHELFGAGFHGMSIHLWKVNQRGETFKTREEIEGDEEEERIEVEERGWKVELNFQVVFSPALKEDIGRRDWNLSDLFRKKLENSCPLADSSIIRVLKPLTNPPSTSSKKSSGLKQLSVKTRFILNPLPPSEIRSNITSSKILSSKSKDDDNEDDEDDDEEEEDLEILKDNQRMEENRFYDRLNKDGQLIYDVSDLSRYQDGVLDLGMSWPGENVFEYPDRIQPPPITAERSFKGYGQERGTIELKIRNNQMGKEINVLYFEQLPWFVKPLLHTMKTEVIEDEFDENSPIVHFTDDLTLPILNSINYQPSVPRESPALIEANLRIPATSQIILTYEFEKAFLRYMEHPPDAHRGFDLPPAIIKVLDEDHQSENSSLQVYDGKGKEKLKLKKGFGKSKRIPKIFTTTSLVELAVPDFSMPYNVIIMTSTVIALFFGSVFNNLVRSYKDLVVDV